ncbi:hypothetical protein Acr_01g0003850 [Actinidia rufa]|uniref:Uncharacterized protein n=1 Tax=Actinidia rufa TaxID=165716 RepID=A0A7J0E381_9ERIC|nr:hypothetical protein Acr_01g0003850 [Actinidia rufa]
MTLRYDISECAFVMRNDLLDWWLGLVEVHSLKPMDVVCFYRPVKPLYKNHYLFDFVKRSQQVARIPEFRPENYLFQAKITAERAMFGSLVLPTQAVRTHFHAVGIPAETHAKESTYHLKADDAIRFYRPVQPLNSRHFLIEIQERSAARTDPSQSGSAENDGDGDDSGQGGGKRDGGTRRGGNKRGGGQGGGRKSEWWQHQVKLRNLEAMDVICFYSRPISPSQDYHYQVDFVKRSREMSSTTEFKPENFLFPLKLTEMGIKHLRLIVPTKEMRNHFPVVGIPAETHGMERLYFTYAQNKEVRPGLIRLNRGLKETMEEVEATEEKAVAKWVMQKRRQ